MTDLVMLVLAEEDATLLTADLDLWIAATKAGLTAVNFNHLRDANLYRA